MKTNAKFTLFVFIVCAIIFPQQFVHSQNSPNIDVVLVIDSSGSMQKTDPLSLRVPAAKLFISLLEKGDRVGIVSFSDRGYVLSDLTPVERHENKEKLFSAAERISADGLYTNLFEGFKSGYEMLSLQKDTGRERIMVLMSDGMMDVGNLDQDARLIDTLESSLTEALRSDTIRVYTIAFTDQSDRKLLEKISKRTGGFYNTALTDKDFHGVFTSIFESLKSPEMVPMSENGFVIDTSIEELTIVATKSDPDTEIQIISPNGDSYSKSQKYSGIGWFASENFDMITILKPLEGRWEILFSTGENNKAYIITNLRLQSDFDQMYAIFGEHLDIRIWLERDSARITEEQVLDKINVYIELNGPDGNTTKLQAFHKGDGIFQRTFAPFTAGNHKMKLVAEGMTFQRAKSFAFNVANLEESKKDIQAQREEKKRRKEGESGHGPDDEGEVSFLKLFVQFIGMNILFGLLALCYFKREKVKDFVEHINVKDLMQRLKGVTKFIKRNKKGQEQTGEPAQSSRHVQAKADGAPAAEQAPQTETGKQPETGTEGEEAADAVPLELHTNEGQTTEAEPQAEGTEEESTEEIPIKQEESESPAIESPQEPEMQDTEAQGDGQKQMIDLEEIELHEKGKQEEALQEDKAQMLKSHPDGDSDDLLDAVTQAVEMLQEETGQPAETPSDDSDDIELTPKDSPDQTDESPLEAASEEEAGQPAETPSDDSDDIELTPKDSPDQTDESPLEAASGEGIEPQAETASGLNASDSVIAEMEEAMNQEQSENGDTATPSSSGPKNVKPGAGEDISSA